MLKFINLKKLTANTLIGILLAGGLVAESGNRWLDASSGSGGGSGGGSGDGSCSNNGHGNNLPIYITLASGNVITINGYDSSNPGKSKDEIKSALNSRADNFGGSTSIEYSKGNSLSGPQIQQVLDNIRDIECPENALTLTGTIRDFQSSHSDFEFNLPDLDGRSKSNLVAATTYQENTSENIDLGYTVTNDEDLYWTTVDPIGKNIVTDVLGADGKPVYNSTEQVQTVASKESFDQWYRDVPGVNKSAPLSITLEKTGSGMYQYSTDSFFPINDRMYGPIKDEVGEFITAPDSDSWMYGLWTDGEYVDSEGETQQGAGYKNRNYHFTYELHQQFTYKGGEVFEFVGDDDVWVYINGKRVIDLSGVHKPETARVTLDAAKAAELGLEVGKNYSFDFFFAERNFSGSDFTITTSLDLKNYLAD